MATIMSAFSGPTLSNAVAATATQLRQSVVQVRAGANGLGSGVVWQTTAPQADGTVEATILTNAHVVRAGRDTRSFEVLFADGREQVATLLALDPEHDLAALRLRSTDVVAASIGDSQCLRVGELVLAVGNPFGLEGAVTVGVVAAKAPVDPDVAVVPAEGPEQNEQRPQERFSRRDFRRWAGEIALIQSDIRLYPGNSGGPLANARGQVVGINAMIGGGLALSIPAWMVERFLKEAQSPSTRTYVGVQLLTVPLPDVLRERFQLAQATAALVAVVEENAPAARAGVLIGDVVLALDGVPIASGEQLVRVLNRAQGDRLAARTLTLLRAGERIDIFLEPEARAA